MQQVKDGIQLSCAEKHDASTDTLNSADESLIFVQWLLYGSFQYAVYIRYYE